jgi:V-type H+-transporting ATPase 16kDa proteolipid subunit
MFVLRPDLMVNTVLIAADRMFSLVPPLMVYHTNCFFIFFSACLVKTSMPLAQGFTQLGAGMSVGLAGLAAGFAVGIVGDAGV